MSGLGYLQVFGIENSKFKFVTQSFQMYRNNQRKSTTETFYEHQRRIAAARTAARQVAYIQRKSVPLYIELNHKNDNKTATQSSASTSNMISVNSCIYFIQ